MDNDELTSIMHLSHEQDGVTTSKSLLNKQCWHEYLQEFLFFLEGIGYIDVRKKVAIDSGVFTASDLGWYGPVFNAEETEVPINTEAAALSGDLISAYNNEKDGWVTWDGNLEGDIIPHGLHNYDRVLVRYRVGHATTVSSTVGGLDWRHDDHNYDIVAYKVI